MLPALCASVKIFAGIENKDFSLYCGEAVTIMYNVEILYALKVL